MHSPFAGIVDYAGLFPPAACTMADAVAQYEAYRRSGDRWMLGRFVAPATRLSEMADAMVDAEITVEAADPWRVSAVLGPDLDEQVRLLAGFADRWSHANLVVDAVELKASTAEAITSLAAKLPRGIDQFFELPPKGPYQSLMAAIRQVNGCAKIRTGGTTPELFPSAADLAAFLSAATSHHVRFKATAGLHHPYRGQYPLTYEAGSARHTMYGFVNLLLATAELRRGGTVARAIAILEEGDPSTFNRDADGLAWRETHFGLDELAAARAESFLGFGSCSFREPVDELASEVAA